jgi:phage-related protein
MKTLPGELLQATGALQTATPWVELLDFSLPYGRHWRIANNTEPLTYQGAVYAASSFEPEVIALNRDAQMPQFSLRLTGLGGQLDQWLLRPGGLEGYTLTVALVNTRDLAADYSDYTTVYDIRAHQRGTDVVDLELGGPNLYRYRFPFRRYLATLCDVEFKGPLCGYVGPAPACLYTLTYCRLLGNGPRFGGTPGQRPNSLKVVT